MTKKKYIYLNNYDDNELDGKIRKVMDADRQGLDLNDESDLARHRLRKRGRGLSPRASRLFVDRGDRQTEEYARRGLDFSEYGEDDC